MAYCMPYCISNQRLFKEISVFMIFLLQTFLSTFGGLYFFENTTLSKYNKAFFF